MVSGLQLATCQHDAKAKGQQVGAATNSEMKFSPFFSNQKWMICRAAKAYPKTTPAKAAPPILSRRSILSQQSQQSAPKTASSASNDKEVWVFVCGFDLKWSFVYVTSFFLDLAAAKYVELCRKSSEAVESWDDSRAMCTSTAGHFVAARKVRLDVYPLWVSGWKLLQMPSIVFASSLHFHHHFMIYASNLQPSQDKALRVLGSEKANLHPAKQYTSQHETRLLEWTV